MIHIYDIDPLSNSDHATPIVVSTVWVVVGGVPVDCVVDYFDLLFHTRALAGHILWGHAFLWSAPQCMTHPPIVLGLVRPVDGQT